VFVPASLIIRPALSSASTPNGSGSSGLGKPKLLRKVEPLRGFEGPCFAVLGDFDQREIDDVTEVEGIGMFALSRKICSIIVFWECQW
jgi:hypothetical protein